MRIERCKNEELARAVLCLGLGLCLTPLGAVAQVDGVAKRGDPDGAPQPAMQAYWLRVTADRVNLRSRPDANSIVVARVERDTILRAEATQFGWHRILPPEGVFSLVSAAYIDRRGPTEGVVSTQSGMLRVRAGSLVQKLNPERSDVQARLERGTPVRIVGEQEGWLKIVPPPAVRVYVSGDYVESASDEVAARLRAATSQPHPAKVTPPHEVATSQPTGPDLSSPWGQRLLLVETAIEAEAAKPLLDQAWTESLARLRPIAMQREKPAVARLAAAWIARLEQRVAERDALRAAKEVLRRTARERAQHEREMERIDRLRRRASGQAAFTARGELQRSVAVGAQDEQPRYKLQSPLTRRVEAYLETEPTAKIDLEKYLGKYVGVHGQRRFEPSLGAVVVRVEAIAVLTGREPVTQPARRGP